MKKAIMAILLLGAGVCSTLKAQKVEVITSTKEGWHKIGTTTVSFKKETDQVFVMGHNKFTQLKFKVKETPIELVSLDLHYSKGSPQKITVNNTIAANGESQLIKFDSGERSLTKITFVYKTLPNRKDERAHVEIWGYKKKK